MAISIDKQGVKMNTKKVTWYEKTVEYAFARKFLEAEAMPLSGTAEKVGDTIFYEGNSFFIIEFKRGLNVEEEKKKEREKYLNFLESAQKILELGSETYPSHYVVWGYIDGKQKFGLMAQCYIDFIVGEYLNNKVDPWELTSIYTGFYPIKDLKKLKTYLQLLIDEKKSSSKDSSSVDYGNILVVDKDGNACALSNREGLQKLELNFSTNTPSPTPSPK